MRCLKLVFVSDQGPHGIAIDGDEESLRPESLIAAYPELLCDAVQNGSVRIIESTYVTRIFTEDAELHSQLVHCLRSQLPEQ